MKHLKNVFYIAMLAVVILINGCSKFDDYKDKYMQGGSISYPGKIDSVTVLSGKNRVMLKGRIVADPKLVKYRVFWNSRNDSIEGLIHPTGKIDTFKAIINNLEEGSLSFEIRTYDKDGNISVPVIATGNVYGEIYRSSLTTRGITKAEVQPDNSALINWADVNADAGVIGMQVKYTDISGNNHDTLLQSTASGLSSSLPEFKSGTSLNYRTAFLPNKTAIDTFYTDYQTKSVKAEVTSVYLKNTKQPFAKNPSTDGRWAVPTDWDVNAPVLNHNGYGGWGSDNGTVLVMEGGWAWGASPIINGKMSQTITLPAGTYSFNITVQEGNASKVFIAAAVGASLPDTDNLGSALASADWKSGPISFTLTHETQVTIGFVATIGENSGEYFRVNKVQLYKE
jgi:hypothetical protein